MWGIWLAIYLILGLFLGPAAWTAQMALFRFTHQGTMIVREKGDRIRYDEATRAGRFFYWLFWAIALYALMFFAITSLIRIVITFLVFLGGLGMKLVKQ